MEKGVSTTTFYQSVLCTDSESGDNSLQHKGAYCHNHKVVGSNMLPMKKIGLKKKNGSTINCHCEYLGWPRKIWDTEKLTKFSFHLFANFDPQPQVCNSHSQNLV